MKFENAVTSAARAHSEFERCWHDPNATRFELPVIGVNEILSEHYIMRPQINLTRSMIWDMECKKALDPSTYVPYVISEAGVWGRRQLADGCDLSTYQFSMTSHSFGNGRHFVSNLLM